MLMGACGVRVGADQGGSFWLQPFHQTFSCFNLKQEKDRQTSPQKWATAEQMGTSCNLSIKKSASDN